MSSLPMTGARYSNALKSRMILGYRSLKTDEFQRATDQGESYYVFSNMTGHYYQDESLTAMAELEYAGIIEPSGDGVG